MARQYPFDMGVSYAFGQPWNPLVYFTLRWSPLLQPDTPPRYLLALLGVALPFMFLGVLLSARRLREMGVRPFWSGLCFLPMLHWVFILVLVLCPPARRPEPAVGGAEQPNEPSVR